MTMPFARLSVVLVAVLTAAVLGGCAVKHPTADVANGKLLFEQNCGGCHTLAHAGTTGTIGPNLDDAFRQDRADGVKSTSIQGLVDFWIQYPDTQGRMPGMLVKGQDAQDVAAYVAAVAGVPGQDTGQLAQVGAVTGTTAADGKQIFTGVGGCSGCHTLAAAGATGTVGPNLDTRLRSDCMTAESIQVRGATLEDCIRTAITDPYKYIPSGYTAGVMPANFEQRLGKNGVEALVNFLSTAAK